MTTAYTPGPWQMNTGFIVALDPRGVYPDIYHAEIIAEDSEDPDRFATLEEQKANARLMAAAQSYWRHWRISSTFPTWKAASGKAIWHRHRPMPH